MLVARSYRHSSSPPPPDDVHFPTPPRPDGPKTLAASSSAPRKAAKSTASSTAPPNPPATITRPMPVPTPGYNSAPAARRPCHQVPARKRGGGGGGTTAAHDPTALPPAVAALLAITTIPPPRRNQFRRHRTPQQTPHMSIDDLVASWKSDEFASHSPELSLLLGEDDAVEREDLGDLGSLRTSSSESVPSLDPDEDDPGGRGSSSGVGGGGASCEGPSTPPSLRSCKSTGNLRRGGGGGSSSSSISTGGGGRVKERWVPKREDVGSLHPLAEPPAEESSEPAAVFVVPTKKKALPARTFTSNLTLSIRALRFPWPAITPPAENPLLLFPWTITRPPPPEQEVRYLNPTPATFEEQELPYQLALHAPYLFSSASNLEGSTPMRTYPLCSRSSEAGRLRGGVGKGRPRELRENGDFLRVVVLEMNMRRGGKLDREGGRARMWLPPRKDVREGNRGKVGRRRWDAVSAY
ncbi:hypothetical protein M433DRAFT_136856 [Acidomyces richmondensis BFW]|nr:MAG: hypothetical protein FE78DRAFT_74078 [Acidomyces sp. 'richmondensis']KYG42928.1 hypothetical protein M433DRAFT_136856 [Acidomyces richmondensis BFW]